MKVTLLEKDKDLKPEMSAKVTFLEPRKAAGAAAPVPSKPQILVPQAAVVTRDGEAKVFEIVDGRAAIRPVTTGVHAQRHGRRHRRPRRVRAARLETARHVEGWRQGHGRRSRQYAVGS